MSLSSLDIPPEELDALFSEIDGESTGLVSLCDVVLFLEPPGMSARLLQVRLKDQCQKFALREGQPSAVFERYDADNTGRVSRLQFKEGMRSLGFQLIDESPIPQLAAANWEQKDNKFNTKHGTTTATGRITLPEQEVLAVEDGPKMTKFENECKNQCKAFDQRVEEVERITAARIAALEGRFTTPSNVKGGSTFNPEYDPTFEPIRPPESGPVITRWLAGEKVLPNVSDHQAATIIQANYRGYKARIKVGVHKRVQHFQPPNYHPLPSPDRLGGGYISSMLEKEDDDSVLLACEDALSNCRGRVEGINVMTDLRPLFAKVDRNGT